MENNAILKGVLGLAALTGVRKIVVGGGKKLEGELEVQGAKNSILPLLSGTVLCQGESVLHNCPNLSDADAACRILNCLGCKCGREGNRVTVNSEQILNTDVPAELMREMRSSIVFLGAILGRTRQCRLSFPGGCELGPRPIDLHILALKKMGVDIKEEHGYLNCSAPKGIYGARISLSLPSVGATENIILAAATAKGMTEINNAAREPEIVDLAAFLNKCGAKVSGAGTGTIVIEGVPKLGGAEHRVIPDRIVAATYLCCAAITRGELILKNADYSHVGAMIPVLEQIGCNIYTYGSYAHSGEGKIYINAAKSLRAPHKIRTSAHPGFPTDAQPMFMALASTLKGTTVFVETIFDNRFRHAQELTRLGAKISVDNRVAVVEGVEKLSGAELEATDLRGGAALVTAALYAEGTSKITGISHIDRGYDNLVGNLRKIGAEIMNN
ncbi:MAG: UDP-N-acetylglucosamine 1-carboxyvinyltransferase [Oscillospiraceae bacterium]|nr:UDP-N-acetylglucosamine 1-carboxyvinyltransferase [Oscillospiraceae bacterium]